MYSFYESNTPLFQKKILFPQFTKMFHRGEYLGRDIGNGAKNISLWRFCALPLEMMMGGGLFVVIEKYKVDPLISGGGVLALYGASVYFDLKFVLGRCKDMKNN